MSCFKNPSFFVKYFKTKKPFSLIAKGLRISKLPLLETFGTFCWSKIMEELQNIYTLKDLINNPVV